MATLSIEAYLWGEPPEVYILPVEYSMYERVLMYTVLVPAKELNFCYISISI
jgi:hypothetical protein